VSLWAAAGGVKYRINGEKFEFVLYISNELIVIINLITSKVNYK